MSVIISGAGRGGTNLLTELVKKISNINFTNDIEDRDVFNKKIDDNYGTKLATENIIFTKDNVDKFMKTNPTNKFIFVVRHPIDNCLSKIIRGRKASQGGDKKHEGISHDGTINSSIKTIKLLYKMITHLKSNYSDNILIVRMEDIIKNTTNVVIEISDFLNITPKSYEGFQSQNRNQYQFKRYGNKLDNTQINLYKDINNSYDGFFKNKKHMIEDLENNLQEYIKIYYGS